MIGIIPAAGRGVRFKELGKQYSKTILPYKEVPILIHQIKWLEDSGCNDIRVVVNHQEETVHDMLAMYGKTQVKVVRQQERNGLSGAIFAALKQEDNDSVLIVLGDIVVKSDASKHFNENFVSVMEVDDYARWCMVQTSANKISTFIDKPTERPDTNLALSGVYHILDSVNLYELLREQLQHEETKIAGEFQLSGVLQSIADWDDMITVSLEHIDFGTLEEYLSNRSVKNSRSFNNLYVDDVTVRKSSETHGPKLIEEFNWYNNLPMGLTLNTPRMLSHEFFDQHQCVCYVMEKILAPTFREIYLFLDTSTETWRTIFNSSFRLLNKMESYGQPNNFMDTVVKKTVSRVNDINLAIDYNIINSFIITLEDAVAKHEHLPTLMHGDFCFSNLMYDFNSDRVTMIDPRGQLFGDHYYEVAKLMHSAVYNYDIIDSELYVKNGNDVRLYSKGKEEVAAEFMRILNNKYSDEDIRYIKIIVASLFLSMIPLHSHSKTNQEQYYKIFKDIYLHLY